MSSKKVLIKFFDRLDREFCLIGEEGQLLTDVLLRYHVPFDAVITSKNGNIISEFDLRLNGKDVISLKMVRAYQMTDFLEELEIWPGSQYRTCPTFPNIYHKGVLWFNADGRAEFANEPITRKDFPLFLEDAFVQCISETDIIKKGETIGLALSGGRDSLALLYLLIKTRDRLPDFLVKGVTVCEDASVKDVNIAKEAVEILGIEHKFISSEEVRNIFSLRTTMENALFQILEKYGKAESINCAHAYMRTCVERYFLSKGITKIVFGLHNEDLLAALIRSLINGIPFGESIWSKSWGLFQFVYPLWGITKKELTIYLELVAPQSHSSQGSPAYFDRGEMNRDIQYFLADSIQTLWPGFSFHAFEGYKNLMANTSFSYKHRACSHCGGVFYIEDEQKDICHLCQRLYELNQIQ